MITLDTRNYRVVVHGRREPVEITRQEWLFLEYLYNNRDRVCSKKEIVEHVWPGKKVAESTVEVYVKYLRDKIGEDEILTRRGFGYQLNTGEQGV